ncbi:HTH-type transcriptional regulator DmlR [Sinobacterium norvegicum]|uniref:HTH-type transcriptional regulator DmlR n=1 Tax=Sinobacterium norvegicum TaxID=1641715 RepID=A0ABN8EFP3_9GAMM|nr:LysR family transcriptional regulator [Sinobacterium norvegicum]CAH0991235.1 HTH-type transcriptional regulator DmlR [Sinobacterium norvegicum]
MSKIDDMALFVRVVKASGLAAAGRQVGLSPAAMTARINGLEQHYNTRLLNRSTRKISLTEAGQRFYQGCLRVIAEVEDTEAQLLNSTTTLSGRLRVTAASDFGRQFIAPALAQFTQLNPGVQAYLHLTDGIVNIIEHGFDLAVRYGNLPDSNLMVKPLADNHRVLVAAPDYIAAMGEPQQPSDLSTHRCLVMERMGEPLNEWQFSNADGTDIIKVQPSLLSSDGGVIRQWALAGAGVAYKSIWDVRDDLKHNRLMLLLDDYVSGFQSSDDSQTGLQLVYPSRHYMPMQVEAFIHYLQDWLAVER